MVIKKDLIHSTVASLTQLHVRVEITCGRAELIVCEYCGLHIMLITNYYGKQRNVSSWLVVKPKFLYGMLIRASF